MGTVTGPKITGLFLTISTSGATMAIFSSRYSVWVSRKCFGKNGRVPLAVPVCSRLSTGRVPASLLTRNNYCTFVYVSENPPIWWRGRWRAVIIAFCFGSCSVSSVVCVLYRWAAVMQFDPWTTRLYRSAYAPFNSHLWEGNWFALGQ